MEQFIGSFKIIPEKTENFDAYFEAMKIPESFRDMMKNNTKLVNSIEKEGDGWREKSDYGDGRVEGFFYKLGTKVETLTHGEIKETHLYTLNGNKLDGVHDVGDKVTTSSRYWQGDFLVFEATGEGQTMKTFFSKLP